MLWWTLQKLKSSDWQTRASAARALADGREAKAVPALIAALENVIGGERRAIVEALGAIRHPAAADTLVSALKDRPLQDRSTAKEAGAAPNAEECRAIAEALASIGAPSVPPLIRLLNSGGKGERRRAAQALGLVRDSRAFNPLMERLQDSRSEVRQAAAQALGSLGDARAVPALVKLVAGRDDATRRAAAEGLGALGAPEAADALGQAALNPNEPLQLAAIEALRRIGGLNAGGKLRSILETGKKSVREAAAAALASMTFDDSSAENRAMGAVLRGDFQAALGEGPAAFTALVSALGSKDAGHRLKAVRALEALRSEQALPPLLNCLDDWDRPVQEAAADALVSLGTQAVPGLMERLASGHSSVRRMAALALGRIGAPDAAEALLRACSPNRDVLGEDSESLAAAGTAAESLRNILAKSSAGLAGEILERISAMPDPFSARRAAGASDPGLQRHFAHWSDVQLLARREQQRRGRSKGSMA